MHVMACHPGGELLGANATSIKAAMSSKLCLMSDPAEVA